MDPMIQISGLRFHYRGSDFSLRIAELQIARGASIAFTGPSGSGKTTLVNLIAGVYTPSDGRIIVDGVDVHARSDPARRRFRVSRLGLVFQEFELLEYLNVLDNILLPYRIDSQLKLDPSIRRRATELAGTVGIGDKLRRYVGRLSHGERQRVAICRALLTRPGLVLADEPTGNLDPANTLQVLDLLFECARDAGATLVVITHDHDLLPRFDRVVDFAQFHHTPAPETQAAAIAGSAS